MEIPEPFRSALEEGGGGLASDHEAATPIELYARGLVRVRVGRLREARADFEAARPHLGDPCLLEITFLDVHAGGPLTPALHIADEVIDRSHELSTVRARAFHLKGLILGKLRDTGAAAEALLEAHDLYGKLGEARRQAEAYDTMGSLYAARGQLEAAVSYYSLSLAEKALRGDRYGMAITLGNLGRLHLRAGRYADARHCFRLDLRISEELGDEYGRARMLDDLGRAHLGLEDFEAAARDLRQCLEIASRRGYDDLCFFAHKDLALVFIAQHRRQRGPVESRAELAELLVEADRQIEEARQALKKGGEPSRECILVAARGELLLAAGDDRAIEVLENAARHFAEFDLPDLEIPTMITLAEALAKKGYTRTAEQYLDRSLAQARRDGYARYLPVVRETMRKLELAPSIVEERGRLSFDVEAQQTADGYTHLRPLGKGGFGEVFRALDQRSNQIVAIKRLRMTELYDPLIRKRLLDSLRVEMEAASRIRHPGIARVISIGTDSDDRPYLVQEFVEGISLRQLLEIEGRLTPEAAILLARDVAGALAELHSWGIIHRDLKPENIVLRSVSGQPVLIDFGIAYVPTLPCARDPDLIVGTLSYMAPEQASGEAVSGQTDVYSLGTIVYECLAGKLPIPFEHSSLEKLKTQIRERNPVPLAQHCPDLSPSLLALVDRMLKKDPSDRPVATAVVRECIRYLKELAGEKTSVSAAEKSGSNQEAVDLCPGSSSSLPTTTMPTPDGFTQTMDRSDLRRQDTDRF